MSVEYAETARALLDLADAVSTDTPVVRRAEAKGLGQKVIRAAVARIDAEIPTDDGVPPAAPTGVTVEPGMRQLVVSWNEPPSTDWVDQTRIITSRDSNAAIVRTQWIKGRSVTVPELDSYRANGTTRESYVVKVVHFDRFGRQSAITSIGPTLPLLSASEEVDLAKLAILGRLQGELPNSNLATLEDAILLGNGVVQARSMTSMDAAAINLWVQNAAIQSAKIADLKADKITAGILSVAVELNSAGRIKIKGSGFLDVVTGSSETRQMMIDAGGLSLGVSDVPREASGTNRASKVTPLGADVFTSLNFFSSATTRGTYIRAEGSGAGGKAGHVIIDALTSAGSDVTINPTLELISGVNVTNQVRISGGARLRVETDLSMPSTNSIDAGAITARGALTATSIATLQSRVDTVGSIVFQGQDPVLTSVVNGAGARVVPTLIWSGALAANAAVTIASTMITGLSVLTLFANNGAQFNYCDRDSQGGRIIYQTTAGNVRIQNTNGFTNTLQLRGIGN